MRYLAAYNNTAKHSAKKNAYENIQRTAKSGTTFCFRKGRIPFVAADIGVMQSK
jgi:hypothetical protein